MLPLYVPKLSTHSTHVISATASMNTGFPNNKHLSRCFPGTIFLEKVLDYKVRKQYLLTVKVEDNAPVGERRSAETTVQLTVSFASDNTTSDPETVTELELTFEDADYDSVVGDNMENFIVEVKRALTQKYPNAIFVHFSVRRGSIIVTFEMISKQSQQSEVLNQIANDVNSPGGLQLQYNGTTLTTNDFKQDGTTYKVPENNEDDESSTVVSCLEGLGALKS